jgi:hypothetical protein
MTAAALSLPAASASLQEIDLFTESGELRRNVVSALLLRIEGRLLALAHPIHGNTGNPGHGRDARQQLHALRVLQNLLKSPSHVPLQHNTRGAEGLDLDTTIALQKFVRDTHECLAGADLVLNELLPRVRTQALGAWAGQLRSTAHAIQQCNYAKFEKPNCASVLTFGAIAQPGLSAPLPGAAAGVVLGAAVGHSLGTADDGSVLRGRFGIARIGAWVCAGLAFIKARLSIAAIVNRFRGKEFNDLDHYLRSPHGKAHGEKLDSDMLAGLDRAWSRQRGLLERAHGLVNRGLSLRDLDRLQEQAFAERDQLSRTVGQLLVQGDDGRPSVCAVTTSRRAPTIATPGRVSINTYGVEAQARAHAAVSESIGVSAQLQADHFLTHVDYRSRITFWAALAPASPGATQADRRAIDARAQALGKLGSLVEPALARMAGTADFPIAQAQDRSRLEQLLGQVEREFDLYCYARRQQAAGRPRSVSVSSSIEAAWNATGKNASYVYLQRVAIAHALIGLRLRALEEGDAGTAPSPSVVDRLARKIAAPPMPHDSKKAERYVSFDNSIPARLLQSQVSLKAGVAYGMTRATAQAALEASVAIESRRDPNMLREGEYRNISFELSLDAYTGAAWKNVEQSLKGHADALQLAQQMDGAAHQVKELIEQRQLGLTANGSVRIVLRFFRPGASLGGGPFRFQFARALTTLGVGFQKHTRALGECWGDGTLTYLLMRHHRFHSVDPGDGRGSWARFAATGRQALEGMFTGLADGGSIIHGEAGMLWKQLNDFAGVSAGNAGAGADDAGVSADDAGPGSGQEALARRQALFFRTMRDYESDRSESNFSAAFSVFEDLAQAHLAPWAAHCKAGITALAAVDLAR